MTKTTVLKVYEPKLQVEKPGAWQEYAWRAQELFGMDTRGSKEVVAARMYERALGFYKGDVEECGRIAERLKGVYEKVRSEVGKIEQEARLGKPVEVDGKQLGMEETLKLSGSRALEAAMESLRADLSAIPLEDPNEFMRAYGTSLETYVSSGEAVLGQLEDALVLQREAEGIVGQKKDILERLRVGRERSFGDYLDAQIRHSKMQGMLVLLETEGLRQALVIQAAENGVRLEAGIEYLTQLYDHLVPTEVAARVTLADLASNVQLLENKEGAIAATVAELAETKNNGN